MVFRSESGWREAAGERDDYRRRSMGFLADGARRSGEYSATQVGFNREGRWSRRRPGKGESLYGEHGFGFDVRKEAA